MPASGTLRRYRPGSAQRKKDALRLCQAPLPFWILLCGFDLCSLMFDLPRCVEILMIFGRFRQYGRFSVYLPMESEEIKMR
jgi:hypothetical protein